MRTNNRLGQITIFIIIAIVIVAGVVVFFAVRSVTTETIDKDMKPVYDYYLSCIEENAKQGISLLGEQGGYIEVPNFVPGSQYMPFSSQLDFFGQPVAYWMYVSGNNILKEQVPTKTGMQTQLNKYVKDRLKNCDFSEFNLQGYGIEIQEGSVSSSINDLNVALSVDNRIVITFENKTASLSSHKISVDSKLGKFFALALKTFDYEKKNMFLEKYGIDVMRLYAPVDGVEISCAPKVFNKLQIKQDLQNALASNVGALKLKGNYYTLKNKENNYFVTNIGESVDENVNFIYNPNFPTKVEIFGSDVAKPVGLQQGLGILGFCYIPYHLVYDINYPVLIQFYDNREIFQFPVGVVISKNQERNAIYSNISQGSESDVCQYLNQDVQINSYDSELNSVKSSIMFKCLNSECSVGETNEQGQLNAKLPQCVNGFIVANAQGFAESKYQISTNEENIANVVMSKIYNLSVSLKGSRGIDSALVMFNSENYNSNFIYPDSKSIELIEGDYNVSVYVYQNSSINFPGTSDTKCVEVPKGGIGALFGATEEKCIDFTIPAQTVEYAVVGGGKNAYYVTESELRNSKKLNVGVSMFKSPGSLQDVQDNYNEVESSTLELEFLA